MKHCIVTPDTFGPVKGGGIGTSCYYLARHLAQAGHDVTILLTITIADDELARCKKLYADNSIQLIGLQEYPSFTYPVYLGPDLKISLKVFKILKNQTYDQLHFQDWRAHGFHCIQAKNTLGLFQNTRLTVTAHANTQWISDGMAQWNTQHTEGRKLMWAEQYAVGHCDTLISPSAYMLDWMRAHQWQIPTDHRVIPNLFELTTVDCRSYLPEPGTFAFFGRLETRKGLELFCDALNRLDVVKQRQIRRILFVGAEGLCGGLSAREYIRQHMTAYAGRYTLHTNLDSFAAQELLFQRKALICIPSLADNLPYAVVECACRQWPVMATNIGGIPEILPSEQLFAPTVIGLAGFIERIMDNGFPKIAAPRYDPHQAEEGWSCLANEKFVAFPEPAPAKAEPLVSVCVAHFNHGAYLTRALESLAAQDYPNFEVIVIDDGSTDSASINAFETCKVSLPAFRFYEKHNEGPCLTRNFAVQQARGEFLLFFDADNYALPSMLTTFVNGMAQCNADALSSHFWAFTQDEAHGLPKRIANYWAPLGADVVTGLLENVFGDVNFMIRKTTFDQLGGFANTRHGCEDWEFMARLALAGFHFDTIPEPLFWYRLTPDGMRSNMSLYHSHQLVFSTYKRHMPSFSAQACEWLLLPMLGGYSASNAVIIRTMLRLGIVMEESYIRMFPSGSRGQRLISALWRWLSSISFLRRRKNAPRRFL